MADRRPRILDAFCGGGGAAWGYHLAGRDVVGIDEAPMPHYPFMDLIQGDALLWLADRGFLADFDAIHASPPCKAHTTLAALHRAGPYAPKHLDLIPETRELLEASGLPWVIENVVGAPLRDPTMLCGSMFGLGAGDAVLRRHRLFESNLDLGPAPPDACAGRPVVGVYGTGGGWARTAPGGGGTKISGPAAAAALGIGWTSNQPVLAQAIPPAYTRWVGARVLDHRWAA